MRQVACFASSILILTFLGSPFSLGEGLSGDQEQALSTLVGALTDLKAHPDDIEKIQSQIVKEQESALAESTLLDSEIEELSKLLSQVENQLNDLSTRLEAVQGGQSSAPTQLAVSSSDRVDFNRDIRQILSNNCYQCHGPGENQRKAGLRLDTEEGALAALKSGNHAVVPGDRNASALVYRITTADEADRMPPIETDKTLTPHEIDLIGRWIDQGAEWERHWAFISPKDPELPQIQMADWPRNPIDRFIMARLEKEGLTCSPEADKRTLIRRVTLDLTGLPPTREEVHAFLADESPDAYEKVVDRLLASEPYGEHQGRHWLDIARYADTNGYHIDNERFMWRWRDWVIKSYNENKPFNEFIVEQIAGDLLPNPSTDQLIATGFNRNHMINFEGGAIPEEYRIQYVKDRVITTGTAFMGLTLDCAQCHDHKFDPISQKEFYQMFAFFNTIPEEGLDGRDGNSNPFVKAPRPEEETKLASLREDIEKRRKDLDRPMPELDEAQVTWEAKLTEEVASKWQTVEPVELKSATTATTLTLLDDSSVLAEGENPIHEVYEFYWDTDLTDIHALKLEALTHAALPKGGVGRADNAHFYLSEFEAEVVPKDDPEKAQKVAFEIAEGNQPESDHPIRNAIDGNASTSWAIRNEAALENKTAVFIPKNPISVGEGARLRIRLRHDERDGHNLGRFRLSASTDPKMAASNLGLWYVSGPFKATEGTYAHETAYPPEAGAIDLDATYEDGRQKWVRAEPQYQDGQIQNLSGDVCATYLFRKIGVPSDRTVELSLGSNDSIKVWVNGNLVHDNPSARGAAPDQDKVKVDLKEGENTLLLKVVNHGADYAFYFRRGTEQVGEVPFEIEQILARKPEDRSEEGARSLQEFYRSRNSPEWKTEYEAYLAVVQEEKEFNAKIPTVMVMKEMPEPRETHMLVRGDYDKPGDVVLAKLPSALPPLPEGAPNTRLGFAKWLTDPSHPLTSRVVVNRFWQRLFGTGIVKTAEDFGTQGEWPSHPELLDWLATEFVRSGWDVKAMHKLMVTSAAYRQSSKVTPELLEKDPANRLLARGPRFRLEAEEVRDTMLALGGLLVEKVGGPSVKPYQPKGLWEEVAYGSSFSAQSYTPDTGESLYRRSMYTFWKRQCPPPQMAIFDAPNREVCASRRARTNTPLQALALLNDPQYVEAARAMGERIMKEGGASEDEKISFAFETATARLPSEREVQILKDVYNQELEDFRSDAEAAKELVSVGESQPDENCDPAELAAWTQVASTILNLDEVVTKG